MFRKNLTVVYKPMKNNSVLLPDNYYRSVQSYVSILNNQNNKLHNKESHKYFQEHGCICLSFQHNQREHFMAWAPYGSNMRDTEIGINSNVAKAIGKI